MTKDAYWLILAGNHKQATSYARERNLKKVEFKIINDYHGILGIKRDNSILVLTGEWRKNKSSFEVVNYAKCVLNIKIIEDYY